ncbi:hypothetical protein [Shimia sp.]|uniref:hypothetical protein n=1 Tax=Shimia sp. TaxID=1954381 RepID=UPI003299BE63
MVPTSAIPCGFHNYAPLPTLVDQLLGSDEIVLARSAPDNPFRFEAIEALEGPIGVSEIPYLVDSGTRRRLAIDANAAVLFARDGAYGPWQRLAFVDTPMASVLTVIMERLPAWKIGDDLGRFRFFAGLVGHPDDQIHKLALRELDQADYSILRALEVSIDPQRLLVRINDPNEAQYRAIRLLLLGLSDDARLSARLERGIQSSVSSENRFLGAYATALIELAGPDAVASIAANYLTDRQLSLLSREVLIEAVALHSGSQDIALERSISKAVNTAIWLDPRLAGAAARQFGARGNWSLQPILRTVLEEGTLLDVADRQDALQYVTLAQDATIRQ